MALKVLLLRKQKENKERELEALRQKSAEFETRESELTAAIDEVENDEQRSAVEEMVTAFETERDQHRAALDALEAEVRGITDEIAQLEAAQNTEPEKKPEPENRKDDKPKLHWSTSPRFTRSYRFIESLSFGLIATSPHKPISS